jgi:hypothetical protein
MITADEWHGTWKPIKMFVYDEISDVLGPECNLVGFEQRCGKIYKASKSGMRSAAEHERKCTICRTYKRTNGENA